MVRKIFIIYFSLLRKVLFYFILLLRIHRTQCRSSTIPCYRFSLPSFRRTTSKDSGSRSMDWRIPKSKEEIFYPHLLSYVFFMTYGTDRVSCTSYFHLLIIVLVDCLTFSLLGLKVSLTSLSFWYSLFFYKNPNSNTLVFL